MPFDVLVYVYFSDGRSVRGKAGISVQLLVMTNSTGSCLFEHAKIMSTLPAIIKYPELAQPGLDDDSLGSLLLGSVLIQIRR